MCDPVNRTPGPKSFVPYSCWCRDGGSLKVGRKVWGFNRELQGLMAVWMGCNSDKASRGLPPLSTESHSPNAAATIPPTYTAPFTPIHGRLEAHPRYRQIVNLLLPSHSWQGSARVGEWDRLLPTEHGDWWGWVGFCEGGDDADSLFAFHNRRLFTMGVQKRGRDTHSQKEGDAWVLAVVVTRCWVGV